MKEAFLNRTLPISRDVDVIVVGGGSAGCFAAMQAAAGGAGTLLIEKNGMLGGTITTAYVNFPGLFHAWGRQVIGGLCWQAILRTAALGGATLPDFSQSPARHWEQQVWVNRFLYASVLDAMCLETGVEIYFHEMPAWAEEDDAGITLFCAAKEGLQAYRCKTLIDATGDADITGMLGYPRLRSPFLQPGTLMNTLGGYRFEKVDLAALKTLFEKALAQGGMKITDCQNEQRPFENELRQGKINMHVPGIDASTSGGKTAAEVQARKDLLRIISFLKTVPGCEELTVPFVAEECGIRETWRIDGEAYITAEEYMAGTIYPDAVCYSFYPIDLHLHDSNSIKQQFHAPGVVPSIPYGALIPKDSRRLLAAGRCISGDTDANSAYRVQATCMATGQAAGAAAAIAAKENIPVKDVNFETLAAALITTGAIVPGRE